MPISLKDAKVGMANKVDQNVIDEFRRASYLLDQLIFDNAVSPGTNGSTMTYGYLRLKTPGAVEFRNLNEEYTPKESVKESATADIKIFGGAFEIDRMIEDTSGQVSETAFQLSEKIKAASALFHNTVINGDSSKNTKSFDGLKKILEGTDTEYKPGTAIDLSTTELTQTNANLFVETLDDFLSMLDGKPSMLLCNSKMKNKLKAVARNLGYYSRVEDAFGRTIDAYDNIPIIDAGEYYNGSTTEMNVPIEEDGTTAIYAVTIGLDGFHGISPKGDKIIKTYLPDFKAPGAVKRGEVEMAAAVVLKNSKKAGVLRNIKIKTP